MDRGRREEERGGGSQISIGLGHPRCLAFTWECVGVTLVSKGTSMWVEQAGEGSKGQRDDGGVKHTHRWHCDYPPQGEASTLSTCLSDAVVGGAGKGGYEACFASTSDEPHRPPGS